MKYFSNGGVGLEMKGGTIPLYVLVYLSVFAVYVCVCDIK